MDAIIMTRDHPHYLVRALESLSTQGVPLNGWVVDTGRLRCQQNLELATRYGWRHAPWPAGEPHSLSRGNNSAAFCGKDSHILLFNDDAVAHAGASAAMLKHATEYPIVGGLILYPDGRVNHAGTFITPAGVPDHTGRGDAVAAWQGTCMRTMAVTFAAVIIQRRVWQVLKGLDEAFQYGFEDVDFCRAGCGWPTPRSARERGRCSRTRPGHR